jgi:hypothetical protein
MIVVGFVYALWISISLLLFAAGSLLTADNSLFLVFLETSVILHIGLAAVATAYFMVYAMEPLRARPDLRLGLIGICLLLTGIIIFVTRQPIPDAALLSQFLQILNTANLLVFAGLIGTWMAVYVQRPSELVPLGVVVMLADGFSVQKGPSQGIITTLSAYYEAGMPGPPPAVDFLLMKIVIPGVGHTVPIFGVSDWIIIVFFSAAAAKFGLNDNLVGKGLSEMIVERRPALYLPISAMGLYVAVLAAGLLNVFLPALPFVVLFFLLHAMVRLPDLRSLNRFEWTATLGAIFCMTGLMLVFSFF